MLSGHSAAQQIKHMWKLTSGFIGSQILNFERSNDINNYNIQFGLEISNRILNCSITDTEIENVVRNLPNNKVVGTDCIRNEYLKSTLHLLLPSYVKIFNIIFDTGIFPESWTLGVIQPVYKNKGDSKDPSNYRPISILSCFSKVFTSMLNNRLNCGGGPTESMEGVIFTWLIIL